jgi:hypothetical protein
VICDRCNWLIGSGCTCRPKRGARLDVERRHRAAVTRAQASGWAGDAQQAQVDPHGIRRWAA